MNTIAEIQTNKIVLRKACQKKRVRRPFVLHSPEEESELEDVVYCRACGGAVTSRDQAFSVNASFSHTFFNPAGIVYELGCYKTAAGAFSVGDPSPEFSWFAGYLWTVALCGQCQAHLGWRFHSETGSFWGLILQHLKE